MYRWEKKGLWKCKITIDFYFFLKKTRLERDRVLSISSVTVSKTFITHG